MTRRKKKHVAPTNFNVTKFHLNSRLSIIEALNETELLGKSLKQLSTPEADKHNLEIRKKIAVLFQSALDTLHSSLELSEQKNIKPSQDKRLFSLMQAKLFNLSQLLSIVNHTQLTQESLNAIVSVEERKTYFMVLLQHMDSVFAKKDMKIDRGKIAHSCETLLNSIVSHAHLFSTDETVKMYARSYEIIDNLKEYVENYHDRLSYLRASEGIYLIKAYKENYKKNVSTIEEDAFLAKIHNIVTQLSAPFKSMMPECLEVLLTTGFFFKLVADHYLEKYEILEKEDRSRSIRLRKVSLINAADISGITQAIQVYITIDFPADDIVEKIDHLKMLIPEFDFLKEENFYIERLAYCLKKKREVDQELQEIIQGLMKEIVNTEESILSKRKANTPQKPSSYGSNYEETSLKEPSSESPLEQPVKEATPLEFLTKSYEKVFIDLSRQTGLKEYQKALFGYQNILNELYLYEKAEGATLETNLLRVKLLSAQGDCYSHSFSLKPFAELSYQLHQPQLYEIEEKFIQTNHKIKALIPLVENLPLIAKNFQGAAEMYVQAMNLLKELNMKDQEILEWLEDSLQLSIKKLCFLEECMVSYLEWSDRKKELLEKKGLYGAKKGAPVQSQETQIYRKIADEKAILEKEKSCFLALELSLKTYQKHLKQENSSPLFSEPVGEIIDQHCSQKNRISAEIVNNEGKQEEPVPSQRRGSIQESALIPYQARLKKEQSNAASITKGRY